MFLDEVRSVVDLWTVDEPKTYIYFFLIYKLFYMLYMFYIDTVNKGPEPVSQNPQCRFNWILYQKETNFKIKNLS